MDNLWTSRKKLWNFDFFFLSHCVYLFQKGPSQFLSHWESAEPVCCSEELSFLPFKNQNKSLVFSSGLWAGKFRFQIFCWMLRIIVQHFYRWKSSVVHILQPWFILFQISYQKCVKRSGRDSKTIFELKLFHLYFETRI